MKADKLVPLAYKPVMVDGKQTFELAQTQKNDLGVMQRCCDAEWERMRKTGLIAAPFYFERVATLLRKERRYAGQIAVCEKYIGSVATTFRPPAGLHPLWY